MQKQMFKESSSFGRVRLSKRGYLRGGSLPEEPLAGRSTSAREAASKETASSTHTSEHRLPEGTWILV